MTEIVLEVTQNTLVLAEVGIQGPAGTGVGSGLEGDLPLHFGATDAVGWPDHIWFKPNGTWEFVVGDAGIPYPSMSLYPSLTLLPSAG